MPNVIIPLKIFVEVYHKINAKAKALVNSTTGKIGHSKRWFLTEHHDALNLSRQNV